MDSFSFISTIVLLRQVDPAWRQRIIVREVLFALVGQRILKLMHLTDMSLGIDGLSASRRCCCWGAASPIAIEMLLTGIQNASSRRRLEPEPLDRVLFGSDDDQGCEVGSKGGHCFKPLLRYPH